MGISAVSVLIVALGLEGAASIVAGFIPASVAHVLSAPDGLVLLPAWLTPLSSAFVHGGLLHLAFNMVMLVYCGQRVEQAVGPVALALLFVIGAYASAAGQWALGPAVALPMVGASGAASAFVAAYALLFAEKPVPAIGPIPSRAVRVLWLAAAWIGIQALVGLSIGQDGQMIAVGAHIGGFVAGLALARPMLLWRYRRA